MGKGQNQNGTGKSGAISSQAFLFRTFSTDSCVFRTFSCLLSDSLLNSVRAELQRAFDPVTIDSHGRVNANCIRPCKRPNHRQVSTSEYDACEFLARDSFLTLPQFEYILPVVLQRRPSRYPRNMR